MAGGQCQTRKGIVQAQPGEGGSEAMKIKKRHAYCLPNRKARLITMKMLRAMHRKAIRLGTVKPCKMPIPIPAAPWTEAELRSKPDKSRFNLLQPISQKMVREITDLSK